MPAAVGRYELSADGQVIGTFAYDEPPVSVNEFDPLDGWARTQYEYVESPFLYLEDSGHRPQKGVISDERLRRWTQGMDLVGGQLKELSFTVEKANVDMETLRKWITPSASFHTHVNAYDISDV